MKEEGSEKSLNGVVPICSEVSLIGKGEIWGRGLLKKSQVCKKELSGGVEAARITQSKQDLLTYAWGDPLLPRSLSLSLSFSFFSHLPRFDVSAFKRNNYLHIFIHNKS